MLNINDLTLIFKNGDGFINRQELGYVMDNLGLEMDKGEIEVRNNCLLNILSYFILTFRAL